MRFLPILVASLVVISSPVFAKMDLAKESQNPVSSMISVPLESNFSFNNGPEDAFEYVLNVKPVVPTSVSENWNLINRVILPVVYQEGFVAGDDNIFGLGDITYQTFFSPKAPGKFIWGVGPMLVVPTGMDRLSSDQWSVGANVVGLMMPGRWVFGVLASKVWSVYGYDNAPDVNFFSLQYFANYNLDSGWYLTTAPIITANWEADNGNIWTVPVGLGVGKVYKIGDRPVNSKISVNYNVERPDQASDWAIELQINLLFPQ